MIDTGEDCGMTSGREGAPPNSGTARFYQTPRPGASPPPLTLGPATVGVARTPFFLSARGLIAVPGLPGLLQMAGIGRRAARLAAAKVPFVRIRAAPAALIRDPFACHTPLPWTL
jgi:hypothetical protein